MDVDVASFWLAHGRDLFLVPAASVIRVEAERDYVRFVTSERTFLKRGTMAEAWERLCPSSFLRIHRSTIVARGEIAGLRHLGNGAWAVVEACGRVAPIGRSYLRHVRAELGIARADRG